jgi:hypothetical protein
MQTKRSGKFCLVLARPCRLATAIYVRLELGHGMQRAVDPPPFPLDAVLCGLQIQSGKHSGKTNTRTSCSIVLCLL